MRRFFCWALGISVLFCGSSFGQIGTADFQCFPTCSETDARMLSLGGTGLATTSGFEVLIALVIPDGQSSFELGIFDGDTGKDEFGVVNGSRTVGHWDEGSDELTYQLLADPAGDSSGSGGLVATWLGNSDNFDVPGVWTADRPDMPNNGWWNATVWTSPAAQAGAGSPFRYVLRISNPAPAATVSSSFKLRTTGSMFVRSPGQAWGIQGPVRAAGAPAARIVYPQWNGSFSVASNFFLTTPTTYDGMWEFQFEVDPGQTTISIFDGDFDFGTSALTITTPSGMQLPQCADTDDANFSGVPTFASVFSFSEGVNSPGDPPDDNRFDVFRRMPCVEYEIEDPLGVVYRNSNPSSNREWELFVVTTDMVGSALADYSPIFAADGSTFVAPGFLPVGTWTLRIRGLDLANTVFLNGPDVRGVPQASLGDRVWLDRDGDGVQDGVDNGDPFEPGINGVEVRLYRDNGDGIFTPNPNSGMAFGFDTFIESTTTSGDGDYLFSPLGAGDYWVSVGTGNFAAGAPLQGYLNTFDYDGQTANPNNLTFVSLRESENFRLADFGYNPGTLGDFVWLDSNADGLYQPVAGELPIGGVRLDLSMQATGTDFTDGDGLYLFTDLRAGLYRVTVANSNFNSGGPLFGLTQTYDLDGTLDNRANYNLAAGQDFLDLDFGYRPPASPGTGTPGYWKNHPEAWPVDEIVIGGILYTKEVAIQFLLDKKDDESEADKTITMFSHLVSAKLNVGLGNDWSCTGTAILDADAWMALYPLGSNVAGSSAAWRIGQPLKNVLDKYNNGKLSCAPSRG